MGFDRPSHNPIQRAKDGGFLLFLAGNLSRSLHGALWESADPSDETPG